MRSRLIAIVLAPAVVVGCGGSGSNVSNLVASYSGTVNQGAKSSVIVEFAVASNGRITGQCTMLSSTSSAIMAQADMTGTVNSDRTFTLSGTYSVFVPPPPGGTLGGIVTVTGTIPTDSGSGTITLTNGDLTYQGQIQAIQQDPRG